MPHSDPSSLIISVRAYPDYRSSEHEFGKPPRKWRRPSGMFVFDTETSIDHAQRLKFGSYQFVVAGRCIKEDLFSDSDLPAKERRILQRHVATEGKQGARSVGLLTRTELVKEFYRDGYKARCLIVGFNLPFDLSRVAYDFKRARKRFAGGFSLGLWSYVDKNGKERPHPFRPWIAIKHIDSKRALKGFTDRKDADEEDRIPEGSKSGKPEKDYTFRGHFLDLRTLAFALTDRGYTLEGACEDFGVEHGKQQISQHGTITEEYIRYNRSDVQATSELAAKLLEEYDRHPIELQATKAYSPASIGKAYLKAMGITPILAQQPDFPKRYLGNAASAFYGGRTSAHIRKIAVPVVYTDFLSMYPTVNSLMDLWSFVTAREIKVVEHCQREVEGFLHTVTVDRLFNPATWKKLTAFVQIIPDGDILPSRARYSVASNDWQVAVNHLYANLNDTSQALWFSLPDVVASVLLNGGRIPKIVDAFRIVADGKRHGLRPTKLRGQIDVDPTRQDFFRVVIEERQRLPKRTDLSGGEKARLDKFLKVLANASSYGIYAEMHRLESDKKVRVTCYGIDPEPFSPRVSHPDEPGAYCFPPLASLITGAARLMLALLESCIKQRGGTYAMEDTDSMAIVATEHGGWVSRAGARSSPGRTRQQSLKALSWKVVDEIAERFVALNPYDRNAVPGSILKLEDDNRDPITGRHRQIHCVAISAKRYVLFLLNERRQPTLLRASCPSCGCKNTPNVSQCNRCHKPVEVNNAKDRWSEHGLGHLLNPTDPQSEDREWIAQTWLGIVRRTLGLRTTPLGIEFRPAVGRITVSSPAVMKPLAWLNEGKHYRDQIKPFNFLLTCHVKPLGHPLDADPARFHLIAPYDSDARQWLKRDWIEQYSGKQFRITTVGYHGDRHTARVKTYGDVLIEYEYHPESKCADANGNPCCKQTVGLLQRRHVRVKQIKYIGKESNSLEEIESGLIHSEQQVYTEYPDPQRDEWQTVILPALRKIPLATLEKESGKSRRMLIYSRTGRRRPHVKNQRMLAAIVRRLGLL